MITDVENIEPIENKQDAPAFNNVEKLQDLDYYTTMARKQIVALGGPISRKMLNDEQAVGDVAYEIMLAETRHDPAKGRTRKSWLNQCALYAIYDYINGKKRHNKESGAELNEELFAGKTDSETVADKELVQYLLANTKLSERQRRCVEGRYLEDKKLKDLSGELGISNWAVSLNIEAALSKLRKTAQCSKS